MKKIPSISAFLILATALRAQDAAPSARLESAVEATEAAEVPQDEQSQDQEPEITVAEGEDDSSVPGGKLLVSGGAGGGQDFQIIDVASANSADAPSSVSFGNNIVRPQGPVTFIGVSVTPASEELSHHLPLTSGTGLVVQNVAADSPAAKAGVLENDILTKLDDQILIHPTQFSVLVAGKKEGDTVTVTLLRKGTTQEIPVTLGKHEGNVSSGAGTLKIGDVEVRIDGNGEDVKPLRTLVKSFTLNGRSPQIQELKLGGKKFQVGDKLEIEGDFRELLKDRIQSGKKDFDGGMHKEIREIVRSKMEAIRKADAPEADQKTEGKGKDESKAAAIRELEEVLRKLKEQ